MMRSRKDDGIWMPCWRAMVGIVLAVLSIGAFAVSASADARVVGGDPAAEGEFPFVASLQSSGQHFCAATLVDAYTLLTAAHCFGANPVDAEGVTAVFDRADLEGEHGQEIPVEAVWTHPEFPSGEPGKDIARIRLAQPVTGITPADLPTRGTDALLKPGTLATLAGWGATGTNDPGSSQLLKADIPIISGPECSGAYPDDFDRASEICAGILGTGACYGDSGGPLLKWVDGRPFIIGIVSRGGDTCAGQGEPTIFTSTSAKAVWNSFADPLPISVTAPTNGATVDTLTPTFRGRGEPGQPVTVSIRGEEICSTTVKTKGKWSCAGTEALAPDTRHQAQITSPWASPEFVNFSTPDAPR